MKIDAHVIRDRMIAGYTAGYRRAQIPMSAAEVERQVVADCQLVDGARAAGDLAERDTKPAKRQPAKPRPDLVAEATADTNTRMVRERGQAIRSRVVHGNPLAVSERWGCAAARIARILEGVNRDTSNLVVAVESAELAQLATEYANVWSHFMLRESLPPASGNDPNPFRGMTTRDAARKFQRLVEDICDRSTGKLGHWYVK